MIGALVREQLRSQRSYTVWTAAVLTGAVAFATYGTTLTASVHAAAQDIGSTLGLTAPMQIDVWAYAVTAVPPPEDQTAVRLDTLDTALEDARADGSDVVGLAYGPGHVGDLMNGDGVLPYAVNGAVDWGLLIADGDPPQAGQIALDADYAARHGIAIGDAVELLPNSWADGVADAQPVPLEVSGLSFAPVSTAGLSIDSPTGYVAWDDLAALASALYGDGTATADDAPGHSTYIHLGWSVGSPALDVFGVPTGMWTDLYSGVEAAPWAALAAVALAIGLIVMALAVGRAQAQVRSRWVATARALGARRAHVVAASLAESLLVGVVVGATGIALGVALAWLHVAALGIGIASPVVHTIAFDFATTALLFGGAVILSAIVGAVPAFWSSRVAPATALTAQADLTTVELSRRVSVRPWAIAWACAAALLMTLAWVGWNSAAVGVLALVAGLVTIALAIPLTTNACRRALEIVGARLSRSGRVSTMLAGDILATRPRQHAAIAAIVALALGALVAAWASLGVNDWAMRTLDGNAVIGTGVMVPFTSLPLAAGITAAATGLVTAAIAAATATLTEREAAAREALGASRRDTRVAAVRAYLAAWSVGAVAGLLIGAYAGAALTPGQFPEAWRGQLWGAWAEVLALTGAVTLVMALGGVLGSIIVSRTAATSMTPSRLESVA